MRLVEVFEVVGGARLVGSVRVTGAKNSVLKLMAASLLAEGTTVLREVPTILDVTFMAELLRRLGCEVEHGDDRWVFTDVDGCGNARRIVVQPWTFKAHARSPPAVASHDADAYGCARI